MITLPDGFDLSIFIGDIVTYIGMPIVMITFSFCIFRLISYAMNLGGSKNG